VVEWRGGVTWWCGVVAWRGVVAWGSYGVDLTVGIWNLSVGSEASGGGDLTLGIRRWGSEVGI
jgi:hypothetical protein